MRRPWRKCDRRIRSRRVYARRIFLFLFCCPSDAAVKKGTQEGSSLSNVVQAYPPASARIHSCKEKQTIQGRRIFLCDCIGVSSAAAKTSDEQVREGSQTFPLNIVRLRVWWKSKAAYRQTPQLPLSSFARLPVVPVKSDSSLASNPVEAEKATASHTSPPPTFSRGGESGTGVRKEEQKKKERFPYAHAIGGTVDVTREVRRQPRASPHKKKKQKRKAKDRRKHVEKVETRLARRRRSNIAPTHFGNKTSP